MAEPIAVTDILSELNTQWNASNVTKPQLVELNGPEGIFRIDLNRADYIIGQPTEMQVLRFVQIVWIRNLTA